MKKMLLMLITVSLAGLAGAAEENLAKNPGFEENGDWRYYGAGPGMKNEDRRLVVQYDPKESHSGKRALRSADVTTDFRPYAIQFIPMKKGEYSRFNLSVFVKGVNGENFRVGLAFMDVDGKERRFIKNDFRQLKQPKEWEEFTLEFNDIPGDSNEVCILLAPSGGDPGETGEALFDDVVLTGVKAAAGQ